MATPAQTPDIATQWKGLSDDERTEALSRMSDDQKQQLASSLGFQGQAPKTTPPPTPSIPSKPTFGSRLGEAVGIPTSMEGLKQAGKSLLTGIVYPPAAVMPALQGMWQGVTQPMTPAEQSDLAKHPVGQVVNQVAKRTLEGPLSPVGGTAVSNIASDIGNRYLGAAGGDVLGSLVNLLALRKSVGISPEARLNKLTFAAGAKAAGPLEKTMGLLDATADATHAPGETIGDVKNLVNKTKDQINAEYGNAIGPYSNMQIDTTPIAQRIRALATRDMPFTKEGKADLDAIEAAAKEYDMTERPKPQSATLEDMARKYLGIEPPLNAVDKSKSLWTLGALDSKRSRLSADLSAHNAKEGVARYTAERGNINLAIDNAIEGALRDTVYPQADQLAGKPTGYFEDLKQKQSNLIRLQQILNKRIDELQGAQRVQQGAPFGTKVKGGISTSFEGGPHGYISGLMDILRSGASRVQGKGPIGPMTSANAAVSSAMAKPNPVSQSIVLSYPARKLSLEQPPAWWDQDQK